MDSEKGSRGELSKRLAQKNDLAPQSLLLIRLSSIGDIVLTTPLIRLLRRRFPKSRIDYLTKQGYAELLRHHPGLTHLYEFPNHGDLKDLQQAWSWIHSQNYTLILDLHKNLRSAILARGQRVKQVFRLNKYGFRRFVLVKTGINLYTARVPVYRRYLDVAAPLGVRDDGQGTELFIPEAIIRKARNQLAEKGLIAQPLIAIAPGAGFATKRWPLKYFVDVAQKLSYSGWMLCILGDQSDKILAREICEQVPTAVDFTGKLSLLESAALLRETHVLLTNDTGLMHIAEAINTPVVALFGSTVREFGFFPVMPQSQVIENSEVKCRPCSHIGRINCPKGHFLCMRSLLPERVLSALENALAKP